jgi:hypothetical protein
VQYLISAEGKDDPREKSREQSNGASP